MTSPRMRTAYASVLFLSAIFVTWNTVDEAYQFASYADAILCIAIWLAPPTIAAIIGNLSANRSIQRANLGLNLFFLFLFVHYALNGPSWSRQGAEQLHIVLVPTLLFTITALWLPAMYLRVGIYRYFNRRATSNDAQRTPTS